MLVVDKTKYRKFDTKVSAGLNFYVLSQFALILLGIFAFIYHFDNITLFYKFLFAGTLILSTMICGAIFEDKKWVYIAEYSRLILVFFGLNTYYYYWHTDWFIIMLVSSIASYLAFNYWFTVSALLKAKVPIPSE